MTERRVGVYWLERCIQRSSCSTVTGDAYKNWLLRRERARDVMTSLNDRFGRPPVLAIATDDKKYAIVQGESGEIAAWRHGEPWIPSGQVGQPKLVLALAQDLENTRKKLSHATKLVREALAHILTAQKVAGRMEGESRFPVPTRDVMTDEQWRRMYRCLREVAAENPTV